MELHNIMQHEYTLQKTERGFGISFALQSDGSIAVSKVDAAVLKCISSTPAPVANNLSSSGPSVGDKLISLNGQPISIYNAAMTELRGFAVGSIISVKFTKDGTTSPMMIPIANPLYSSYSVPAINTQAQPSPQPFVSMDNDVVLIRTEKGFGINLAVQMGMNMITEVLYNVLQCQSFTISLPSPGDIIIAINNENMLGVPMEVIVRKLGSIATSTQCSLRLRRNVGPQFTFGENEVFLMKTMGGFGITLADSASSVIIQTVNPQIMQFVSSTVPAFPKINDVLLAVDNQIVVGMKMMAVVEILQSIPPMSQCKLRLRMSPIINSVPAQWSGPVDNGDFCCCFLIYWCCNCDGSGGGDGGGGFDFGGDG